jgi:hypothetical protein
MLIGSPKRKGPKTQCLLVRYAYIEDAYIEVLLYEFGVGLEQAWQ